MFWHVNVIEVSHVEQKVLDELASGMTDKWKQQKERKRKYETHEIEYRINGKEQLESSRRERVRKYALK